MPLLNDYFSVSMTAFTDLVSVPLQQSIWSACLVNGRERREERFGNDYHVSSLNGSTYHEVVESTERSDLNSNCHTHVYQFATVNWQRFASFW